MTSRHRIRANAVLHKVPVLQLAGIGSETNRAQSAPTPNVVTVLPRCPKCGHGNKVHCWQEWKEREEDIYHCAYRHKRDDRLCAHMWVESHRGGWCRLCLGPAEIQKHGEQFVYWCPSLSCQLKKLAMDD
jgi:hypothetical protein